MVGTTLELDAVLDVCRHEHRRIVLAELTDRQQSVTTTDLAAAIDERDGYVPLTEVAGETGTRTERSLHHVHLPKLASAGLVDYDADRKVVEPTDRSVQDHPHLRTILQMDPVLATPLET